MDLYISPMSCSLAAHVACIEAGIEFNLRPVRRRDKVLDDGRDYRSIAPQGNVPAVSLPDGSVLTESAAVLQYIADRAPASQLAPPRSSEDRYRVAEWLNFVTTELHKKHVWMIFSTKTPEALKAWSRDNVAPALDHVAARLRGRSFLLGDTFTVADAYLFWALFVLPHGGVPLHRWPELVAYVERLSSRPSISRALQYEGPLFLAERTDVAVSPPAPAIAAGATS